LLENRLPACDDDFLAAKRIRRASARVGDSGADVRDQLVEAAEIASVSLTEGLGARGAQNDDLDVGVVLELHLSLIASLFGQAGIQAKRLKLL
jgi:hypothetical protein